MRPAHDFAFGPETSAEVRNVANPLRLRALLEPRACTAAIPRHRTAGIAGFCGIW